MDPRLLSDFQEAGRGIAMAKLLSAASSQGHEAVHVLFEAGGPVLVEVRHPGGIFSSDWHLCDSDDEFDRLLDQVEPESVLHVSRVWDLHNRAGAVVLRR
jgi:hypothetical protein